MPTQLPSGNWRPRVRHPRTRKHINPATIIGGPSMYPPHDRAGAERAEQDAVELRTSSARAGVTVRDFWTEWTSEAPWLRPAESTNIHNRERTQAFVDAYAERPIRAIDDETVREYRRPGG